MATKKKMAQETEDLDKLEESGAEETGAATVKRVYIGPSLPFGKLRQAMILEGTEEEIGAFTGDLLESYPEIPYLLVDPAELTESMKKVEQKGTILHKYYGDVQAKSRAQRTGNG